MDLPTTIELTRCGDGAKEAGRIESLTRETAKREIDVVWWKNLNDLLREPDDEPDRHWEWRVIVSVHQNKPTFQAKCVRSSDSEVQAAMLLRVDAMSALDNGKRALFVDRLATAPTESRWFGQRPCFSRGRNRTVNLCYRA